jgi:heptose I phosphotransferase
VTYGRAPIMSAENEWRAIDQLRQLGIPTLTLAGIGKRGSPPAWLESFVITEALDGMISLEELTRDWRGVGDPQRIRLKRAFIKRLAEIARVMHSAGLNHRDFYLCHFLVRDRGWTAWTLAEPLELFIIDLHRVQIRERVPERWLVKDLGGLCSRPLMPDLRGAICCASSKSIVSVRCARCWKMRLCSGRKCGRTPFTFMSRFMAGRFRFG